MVQVYLSIGSNIGRYRHISAALDLLHSRFGDLALSSVYESVAVGFVGDPFLNLVVGLQTDSSVTDLASSLREFEASNGRCRGGPKFGARTLDIDILTYGDVVGTVDGVVLPRDEIIRYAFVLLPLSELSPTQLHPALGQTYAEMWQHFEKNPQQLQQSQQLWPVDFCWNGEQISKAD